jgi:uncharacterized membrane protein (UPF0127 family)
MPNNDTAKIKSAPKRHLLLGIGLPVVVLTLVFLVYIYALTAGRSKMDHPYTLKIGSSDLEAHSYRNLLASRPWTYHLTSAQTGAELEKGLSGTKSLAADAGMLFIFPSESTECFWMKDMNYSLDIIWADNTKKVTAIEKDLSPQTYPKEYCHQGRYVIELNAGQTDKNRLIVGQTLRF